MDSIKEPQGPTSVLRTHFEVAAIAHSTRLDFLVKSSMAESAHYHNLGGISQTPRPMELDLKAQLLVKEAGKPFIPSLPNILWIRNANSEHAEGPDPQFSATWMKLGCD